MSQTVDNSEVLNLIDSVTTSGIVMDLSDIDALSVSSVYDVLGASPATVASADISGDVFDAPAHGFVTGLVGQMTTDDTLPTPLMTLTDYYIIALDADHFSLAATLVDAINGVAITLSDAGAGNQTFTPTADSATLAVYESVDGVNYVAVSGLTATITMGGAVIWHVSPVYSRFYKILLSPTAGAVSVSTTINARNNTSWANADVVIPVATTAS